MKLRLGFVSNSSSASFVLPLKYVSERQRGQIKNHSLEGKELGFKYWDDSWRLRFDEEGGVVSGDTRMDNFDMYAFLKAIGVDMAHVYWCNGASFYAED